jgi:hypothetical protein
MCFLPMTKGVSNIASPMIGPEPISGQLYMICAILRDSQQATDHVHTYTYSFHKSPRLSRQWDVEHVIIIKTYRHLQFTTYKYKYKIKIKSYIKTMCINQYSNKRHMQLTFYTSTISLPHAY